MEFVMNAIKTKHCLILRNQRTNYAMPRAFHTTWFDMFKLTVYLIWNSHIQKRKVQ